MRALPFEMIEATIIVPWDHTRTQVIGQGRDEPMVHIRP